jgi:hypothetical protein
METAVLREARGDPSVARALEAVFDFRLSTEPLATDWFTILAAETFLPIAEAASEDVYLLGEASGRVVFVTTDGQAGVVARSIEDLLELMVTHPFWRDLLKFSGGGQLVEMRRAATFLDKEFHEVGQAAEEDRHLISLISKRLCVSPNERAVELLHEAVSSGGADVKVKAVDGTEFVSLFNHFTVESNRQWHVA